MEGQPSTTKIVVESLDQTNLRTAVDMPRQSSRSIYICEVGEIASRLSTPSFPQPRLKPIPGAPTSRLGVIETPSRSDDSLVQLPRTYGHTPVFELHSESKNPWFDALVYTTHVWHEIRFVVVRDPAERLVSAFMNKCVRDGYDRYAIYTPPQFRWYHLTVCLLLLATTDGVVSPRMLHFSRFVLFSARPLHLTECERRN